jgi:nucleoside-diphosphate-sugar epimerase
MRIFLAGASGVIGVRLIPLLLAGGHELTDLPDSVDQIPEYAERNNRIRTEGTRNLLAAAQAAGAAHFLAQSIAWKPPAAGEAVQEHERMVLAAG